MSARVRAGPDPSRATGHRPFTNACLSFGGHDGRPHLDRPDTGPTQPRRVRPPPTRRPCDGRATRSGSTRLFDHDTTLWSSDERVQAAIAERLGWLEAPVHFADNTAGLEGFGDAVVAEGFTDVVVAGMGGSTLAPDVLNRTFGSQDGYPELRILDSTDPAFVSATLDDLDALRTMTVIATQVGHDRRAERLPRSRAWARTDAALDAIHHHTYEGPGAFIVAITDPGKSLDAIPHHDDFREVFLNPPDIGGRYSALTYVGLVPASLIGLDLDALLASAIAMLGACREPDPAVNPGVSLGLALGTLAKAGRDKLTFLTDDEIGELRRLGGAAHRREHRQARRPGSCRSTSSRSARPPSTDPTAPSSASTWPTPTTAAATRSPMPSRRPATRSSGSRSADPIDLGAEFVRWEVAIAIAGAVLGIDPFDQPNVEEAKELTRTELAKAERGETDSRSDPADRRGRRADALRRRGAPPDRHRRRHRGRAGPTPRAAQAERLPRAPGVHRADAGP